MPLPSPYPWPIRWVDALSTALGRAVSWLTLSLVLVTFAAVVLRYAFQFNSNAMAESLSYMQAGVFMLGAAYTLKHGGHVRVDIFYGHWSPRGKAWADILGTCFLLLPFCAFVAWTCFEYVAQSWQIRERSSEADGLAFVWLLKGLLLAMPVVLALQGLAEAGKSTLFLAGRGPDPHGRAEGGEL
ncbi:MAG: TRAP transporter small permease subunit [Gammaproteobacteria bacterium]|nr:TRAP transporter small permease subunit [Gammaproteobacteria bacterium]